MPGTTHLELTEIALLATYRALIKDYQALGKKKKKEGGDRALRIGAREAMEEIHRKMPAELAADLGIDTIEQLRADPEKSFTSGAGGDGG